MKTVYRLLAATALTAGALLLTPAPSESTSTCLWNCRTVGYCQYCTDPCSGYCVYSCRPPGAPGSDGEC